MKFVSLSTGWWLALRSIRTWCGWMLVGIALIGCQSAESNHEPVKQAGQSAPQAAGADTHPDQTARLVIRLTPDQGPIEIELPATSEMTVLGLMKRAQQDGTLEFEYRGSGETAFVTSIQGLANQGAGGNNWIYRVNGKLGDRSIGVARIAAGDEVTWEFGAYQADADSGETPRSDNELDSRESSADGLPSNGGG